MTKTIMSIVQNDSGGTNPDTHAHEDKIWELKFEDMELICIDETGDNYLALVDADITGKTHVYSQLKDAYGHPIQDRTNVDGGNRKEVSNQKTIEQILNTMDNVVKGKGDRAGANYARMGRFKAASNLSKNLNIPMDVAEKYLNYSAVGGSSLLGLNYLLGD